MWKEMTILWNELTIDWNDLTSNDLTMKRNDRIPLRGAHTGLHSNTFSNRKQVKSK